MRRRAAIQLVLHGCVHAVQSARESGVPVLICHGREGSQAEYFHVVGIFERRVELLRKRVGDLIWFHGSYDVGCFALEGEG